MSGIGSLTMGGIGDWTSGALPKQSEVVEAEYLLQQALERHIFNPTQAMASADSSYSADYGDVSISNGHTKKSWQKYRTMSFVTKKKKKKYILPNRDVEATLWV